MKTTSTTVKSTDATTTTTTTTMIDTLDSNKIAQVKADNDNNDNDNNEKENDLYKATPLNPPSMSFLPSSLSSSNDVVHHSFPITSNSAANSMNSNTSSEAKVSTTTKAANNNNNTSNHLLPEQQQENKKATVEPRENNRLRAKERRVNMSAEQREQRRVREKDRRANMSIEEKLKVKEINRVRERERRMKMSTEQKDAARESNRIRSQQARRLKRQRLDNTNEDDDYNTATDFDDTDAISSSSYDKNDNDNKNEVRTVLEERKVAAGTKKRNNNINNDDTNNLNTQKQDSRSIQQKLKKRKKRDAIEGNNNDNKNIKSFSNAVTFNSNNNKQSSDDITKTSNETTNTSTNINDDGAAGAQQGGLCTAHGAKRKQCNHFGCDKIAKKARLCSKDGLALPNHLCDRGEPHPGNTSTKQQQQELEPPIDTTATPTTTATTTLGIDNDNNDKENDLYKTALTLPSGNNEMSSLSSKTSLHPPSNPPIIMSNKVPLKNPFDSTSGSSTTTTTSVPTTTVHQALITKKTVTHIADPNENDVLCGRGGGTTNHAGNVQFRDNINSKKKEYLAPSTKKHEKAPIAAGIVYDIRTMDPPGRFLKEDKGTGLWLDIGDAEAIKKTSQALREVTNNSSNNNKQKKVQQLRRDKWTPEEEAYANRLIQEFKAGLLPLTEGTTLQTFLSKLLNCDPMRISKKFVGSNCIGNQVFRKRKYSNETKIKVLLAVETRHDTSLNEIASEFDIPARTIKYWREADKIRKQGVERKPRGQDYFDTLTKEQLKEAKVKSDAAPDDYEERKNMLQRADVIYKETGEFHHKDYSISSPSPPVNSMHSDLSAFSFSKDGVPISSFPRMNGTRVLMSPPTRGSCKLLGRSWGAMQPQHSATSGRYDSVVLIGMVKADDCIKADDELKKHGITNTIVGEVLKYWHANARDSAKIMKFYKDETKLEYQPLGIYKSEIPGNVMIGIAQNLQPLYRERMEQEISTDYFEVNKVEVKAPELASLLKNSMGSPRIHFYPAGTGAMDAHYDSCHNHYDDIRQQKYSILFDMRTTSVCRKIGDDDSHANRG